MDPSAAPLPTVQPSPALSQLGGSWPTDGRMIGIVVDPHGDLDGLRTLRAAVFAAGMVPLLVAPHGGMVDDLPVQRTFATARSVEFDAVLLLDECWRHAKAIGAWGAGVTALEEAGLVGSPGVVTGDSPEAVLGSVQDLLPAHRVWERFPAGVSVA